MQSALYVLCGAQDAPANGDPTKLNEFNASVLLSAEVMWADWGLKAMAHLMCANPVLTQECFSELFPNIRLVAKCAFCGSTKCE